jgi:hypothetical protein
MKTYKFIYEDRKGNELQTKEVTAYNLADVKHQRAIALATTKLNDLYNIKIKFVYNNNFSITC